MKEFSKLEINYQIGYKLYFSLNMSSAFLYAVFWALREFYYEDLFIRCLHDPDFDLYGGNEGFIQKVGTMIELYTPHDELSVKPGETATPSAIVSIENLKVLAQDWKQLYEKHAPIIYLIVEDNGWVTLRERLEE